MRIAVIDSLYPDFIASIPFDSDSTYEAELRKVFEYRFGTFDAYSWNLRELGNECIDIIANHSGLQQLWRDESVTTKDTLAAQLEEFNPDVIFLQDLSINVDKGSRLLAAQCSCAFDDASAKLCDVIFTSLPTHIQRIEALGVRAVYLPLAFDPIVLEGPQPERDIDISFFGGCGRESHWRYGTDVLEAVAKEFGQRFHWYGYGLENLSADSPLRACYKGQAFGKDMYSVYRRSKLVLNRHGEVAQGYANNLRMFEATGCGAALVTDHADNLQDFFTIGEAYSYRTPAEALAILHWYLEWAPHDAVAVGRNGQRRTLADHTYSQRMPVVSQVLQEMLCPA